MPDRIVRVRGKRGNLTKKLKLDKDCLQDDRQTALEGRSNNQAALQYGPSFERLPNELLWQIWLDSNNPSLLSVSTGIAQRLAPMHLQFVQSLTSIDPARFPEFDYSRALDQTFNAAWFTPDFFFQIRDRELLRQGLDWCHSLAADNRRPLASRIREQIPLWSRRSTFTDDDATAALVKTNATRDLEFMSAWRSEKVGHIFVRPIGEAEGSFLNSQEFDRSTVASVTWPPLSAFPRRAFRKLLRLPLTQLVGDMLNLLVPPKIHSLWSEETESVRSVLCRAIEQQCSSAIAIFLNVQHFETAWISFYDEFDEAAREDTHQGFVPETFRPRPHHSFNPSDPWTTISWPYIPDERIYCKLDQALIAACSELALSKHSATLWVIGTVFDSCLNWTSAATAHAEFAKTKTQYFQSWNQCAELIMDWLLNRGSAKGTVPMARQIAIEQVFDSTSDHFGKLTSRDFRTRHMRSINDTETSFDFLQYFLAFWKQAFGLKDRLTEVQHRTLFLGKQWHHPPPAYLQLERFV